MQVMDNAPEKFLEQCLLTVILVVAACARFYCLDQNALSAAELSNLLTCDASSWLAMAGQYLGNSGMPPAYPTLLCQFTDWTSHAEFFVRALSAVAGVASVYMVYLLGRYFLSPISGLLVAAAVATNLQMILLDRSATQYPLLTLFMLVHSYCFCRLLAACDSAASRNIAVNLTGERWGLQWHWQPGFSCDARFLLGFWISGVLVFYTSPMSFVLLLSELAVSFSLIGVTQRRMVIPALWVPLLLAMLPWVPAFYERIAWLWGGYIIGVTEAEIVLQKLESLLPVSAASLQIQFFIALVSMLAIGTLLLKRQYSQNQKRFLAITGFQLVAGIVAIWLVKASDPQSYLYFLCIAFFIVAEPVAIGIRKIPHTILRNGMVIVAVLGIMSVQSGENHKNKLYQKEAYSGFEIAARIIRDDKSFMSGSKTVFTSKSLFNYYLEKYGITGEGNLLSGEGAVAAVNKALGNNEFYYLEYSARDGMFSGEHPVFQQLSQEYKILCMSKGAGFRITKFSSEALPTEDKQEECLSYLSKGVAL